MIRTRYAIMTILALSLLIPSATAFSLWPFRFGPPKDVVDGAIERDLRRGDLEYVDWSFTYKTLNKRTAEIDNKKLYYVDYLATVTITHGNNFIKTGRRSEHEGTVVMFRKDKKWFRVVL